MDNRYIGVVIILLIGFIAFSFIWLRTANRTLYGREIDKRMIKRNLMVVGFAWLFAVGMSILEGYIFEIFAISLVLILLIFAWSQWFMSVYRRSKESEPIVYTVPGSKSIPKWLIAVMNITGIVLLIFGSLTQFSSNVALTFGFLLLSGAVILVDNTHKVFFTSTKIYNGLERFEWDRIIWWSWTEESDNYRRVMVQLNGFWSSIDFRTIKVPVDRYEDVDQLFQNFTKQSKIENIESSL